MLHLPPIPATGFRANNDWISTEYYDTHEARFSNFDFVEQCFGKKEDVNTVIRILSLSRQLGFLSMVKEKLSDDNPLKKEEDAWVKKNDIEFEKSEIYRLSFFSCFCTAEPQQGDFRGYAVIKADFYKGKNKPKVYVYESVLMPHRPENEHAFAKTPEHRTNFLRCKRKYEIETCLEKFSVIGALYAQQNGKNFVCAHVALRSVLSLLLPDDISYSEINNLAGRPSYSRDGLNYLQITNVLKAKNIEARRIDKGQFPNMGVASFSPLLYGYIESGCPSLLAFFPRGGGVGHIVPVLGHTFDADSWVPESRNGYFAGNGGYFSSEGWLDSFLIHDDNFGPYQTLPRNYFEEGGNIILWGLHKDKAALCFERMETVALGQCWDFICKNAGQQRPDFIWYNRFLDCTNRRKLVLRSLYIDKDAYIRHLKRHKIEESYCNRLQTNLPKNFWMIELSCRELFSATRAKLGEVLLSVDNVNDDFSGDYKPLVIRLPGVFHFYKTDSSEKTSVSRYIPLFSH